MNAEHSQEFVIDQFILHHIADGQEWKLPFLPAIHLPAPLTVHTLMLFICAGLLIFLFCKVYQKGSGAPRGLTNLLEIFVLFIRDEVVVPAFGPEEGRRMTPLFCTFFFFILSLNLIGMVPIFATATSNLSVTAGLALVTLSFMIFGSIHKNGLKGFVRALIPEGVPKPLLIIIIPIEVIGLVIKPAALLIRLFANLLAGHFIILSLFGLVVLLGMASSVAVFPLAIFIYFLEFLVAFIQAYVFTMLSSLFISQIYSPQH